VVWQVTTHATELGNQINAFVAKTRDWLQNGPFHLKSTDFDKLSSNIAQAVKNNESALVTGAIATLTTLGELLGGLLLVLLSTFFFLRDGERIWGWLVSLLPKPAHRRVDHAGRVGWSTFGGYMRGVVLIALFHAVTITIVLLVVRVPLAPALGVLIFLGSFIPLIGLTVTGGLCVAVALLEHGVAAAITVGVAIILLVQIEGHVLQPLIMSRTVEVHPLAVAVSVLTGTTVAGIPGALIAVPLVAFVNTAVRALRTDLVPTPPAPAFPVGEEDNPRLG
jgi:predicted PurR-regulated permease PerM